MIYMTLPVLLPVVKAFGFDLIWFGVILTVLIELGQITPPVGLNLFTIHAISGGAKFSEVAGRLGPLRGADADRYFSCFACGPRSRCGSRPRCAADPYSCM